MLNYDWFLYLPVGVLIGAALWRNSSEKRRRRINQEEATYRYKRAARQNNPYGPSHDFAALINAIEDEARATREEEQREDRGKRAREIITIVLVGLTLAALVSQVFEMRKVYDPIATQARTAQDTESKQLRAYVFSKIVNFPLEFTPSVDRRYSVRFVNGGETPAYDLSYFLKIGYIPLPTDKPIEQYGEQRDLSRGTPGDYLFREHTKDYDSIPFAPSEDQAAAIAQGKGGIFFLGGIGYTDIFGCRHYTHFCIGLWGPNGHAPTGSRECPTFNDVDNPNECHKG